MHVWHPGIFLSSFSYSLPTFGLHVLHNSLCFTLTLGVSFMSVPLSIHFATRKSKSDWNHANHRVSLINNTQNNNLKEAPLVIQPARFAVYIYRQSAPPPTRQYNACTNACTNWEVINEVKADNIQCGVHTHNPAVSLSLHYIMVDDMLLISCNKG